MKKKERKGKGRGACVAVEGKKKKKQSPLMFGVCPTIEQHSADLAKKNQKRKKGKAENKQREHHLLLLVVAAMSSKSKSSVDLEERKKLYIPPKWTFWDVLDVIPIAVIAVLWIIGATILCGVAIGCFPVLYMVGGMRKQRIFMTEIADWYWAYLMSFVEHWGRWEFVFSGGTTTVFQPQKKKKEKTFSNNQFHFPFLFFFLVRPNVFPFSHFLSVLCFLRQGSST
jgi:hypothetical protein